MIVRAFLQVGLDHTSGTRTLMTFIVFSSWMTLICLVMFFIPTIIRKTAIANEKKRIERAKMQKSTSRSEGKAPLNQRDIGKVVDEQMSHPDNQVKIQLIRVNCIFWLSFLLFTIFFGSYLTGLTATKNPEKSPITSLVFLGICIFMGLWYSITIVFRHMNLKYM